MTQHPIILPEPSVYDALNLIMQYYPYNFTARARLEIETLLNHCLQDIESNSEKFLSTLFIRALKDYIGTTNTEEHIYLERFEIPQIELFNLVIDKFPFVKYAHQFSNDIITQNTLHDTDLILIDIGIGQGIQIQRLIEQLSLATNLQHITVVGIEPFTEAMIACQAKISKLQRQLPITIHFFPINDFVEEVPFHSLKNVLSDIKGKLIINESLALHHIAKDEKRIEVISALKQMNPSLFLLTEPNSNHQEKDFYKRFQNSYNHFYHIFKVIDKLDIAENKRNSLKLFFGREINDIIGRDENTRFERHELAVTWLEKLKRAGFKPKNHFKNIPKTIPPDIHLYYANEGYLGFKVDEETVLSLMALE